MDGVIVPMGSAGIHLRTNHGIGYPVMNIANPTKAAIRDGFMSGMTPTALFPYSPVTSSRRGRTLGGMTPTTRAMFGYKSHHNFIKRRMFAWSTK